ncbi:16S rRNA (cytosine(1402)-N(4))-methyltransferase RsmH [Patescibacteria group bacterium]|nr:16S rRNA (cytosine(1402)-N(4))-methyltransferase RsmH [Patescibacteria group bacterium]
MQTHIPVLKKQVLEYLNPKPNENFVDCTINGGGHSAAILEVNKPSGRILGIELDKEIYKNLKNKIAEFQNRLILVNDSYVNLEKIVEENNFGPVHGILFDLGVSSHQLDELERGFTFRKDQPLDMRYNTDNDLTAEEIINTWSEKEIAEVLEKYGEERNAKRIAKNIIKNRPIKTTFQLIDIIGGEGRQGRIHPATRTFQALRIAVNKELDSLERVLPQAEKLLVVGGRLVIISFHSLEDRIVKNFLKSSNLNILTKKPITGLLEEINENPRARSAKLRAGIKI